MNRSEFLNDQYARDFIVWSANLCTDKWKICHSWTNGRPTTKKFTSLYSAVEQFEWNKNSFKCVADFFDECGKELRSLMDAGPVRDEDKDRFLGTARKIVKWGGINLPSLDRMDRKALHQLGEQVNFLRPECADTSDLSKIRYMGAGYSKIYSALIDGFPIYDSRVACALTSMIDIFRKERQLASIPETLMLGVPPHRSLGKRNPDGFPRIYGVRRYAESNLKAAWILGVWADQNGRFKKEFKDSNRRIMALQSALFMLGYELFMSDAIRKY